MQADPVVRVLEALERRQVHYVIFGAIAVNIHGLPRFTEDLGIFVAPERDNIDARKGALREVFDDPKVDEISADDLLGEYPAIQYIPPEGAFHLDILTRLGEAFRYEDVEAERLPFEGLVVTVANAQDSHASRLGCYKHRTLESMNALQEWADANFAAYQRRLRSAGTR